ncbi:hypothetical protein MCOR30_000630 [Pyricularia oryzae]|nr:hypothetical protein MCOR30_000630 [Pyricularia oryzae]KAI6460318.1 hypothetical protein MCOR15_005552 [Pyricularia oryzae]KAI6536137.1 hypothetical protein MCOR16_002570 [Pyricularia oryzae]
MANHRQGFLDIGPPRRSNRRWVYVGVAFFATLILYLAFQPAATNEYVKSAYDSVKHKVTGDGKNGGSSSSDASRPSRHPIDDGSDTIPNIAHFVYGLKDPKGDLHFSFDHYLSAYSAWYHCRAHTLYLHTNAGEEALMRARSGATGRWTKAIFDIPGFEVKYLDAPTHAGNGREIQYAEHVSDFMRIAGMLDIGGYYIDWDVFVLRDLAPLRKAGFRGIAGRQMGPYYNSGTFMAAPNSLFVKTWKKMMHETFDGSWERHSNVALRDVAKALVRIPGEMLVLDSDAFAPLGWSGDQGIQFFMPHNDSRPLLETLGWQPEMEHDGPGSPALGLPEFVEGDEADKPGWAVDWSPSYLVHAFMMRRMGGWQVDGFDRVTPKYVLDRQSNLARAVYPIVRDMYYRGLVKITDGYD